MPLLDEQNIELQKPYSVLVISSGGVYVEDARGEFEKYEQAYPFFEDAVRFIDELSAKVRDYPLILDTVQLLKGSSIMAIWQRPPWRTEALLRESARRDGLCNAQFTSTVFIRLMVTAQQAVAVDRREDAATAERYHSLQDRTRR